MGSNNQDTQRPTMIQSLLLHTLLLVSNSPAFSQYSYESPDENIEFYNEVVPEESKREERSQQYNSNYNSIYQSQQKSFQTTTAQEQGLRANTNTDNEYATPPSFRELAGFDIVEQMRTSTEYSKHFILTIAQNQETLPLVQELIDTNPCVGDLDGYIGLLERYGKNVELAAPQLEDLFLNFLSVRGTRNMTVLARSASEGLSSLSSALSTLDLTGLFLRCGGNQEKGIKSMRDMALVLYKISLINDIPFINFDEEERSTLKNTAQFIEAITNALDHMRKFLINQDCFTSKDFLGDFLSLASEVIYNASEILGVLGFLPQAKEGRQYAAFTASLKDSIGKTAGFTFPDSCSPGRLSKAASSLSDLADLTAEVGLERLGLDLGVTFRVDLLP